MRAKLAVLIATALIMVMTVVAPVTAQDGGGNLDLSGLKDTGDKGKKGKSDKGKKGKDDKGKKGKDDKGKKGKGDKGKKAKVRIG